MPMTGKIYSFTKENVYKAPALAGVYALFNKEQCIFIGTAKGEKDTLRARLKQDFAGAAGSGLVEATDYMRESCMDPIDRESELLAEFQLEHSKLPKFNEEMKETKKPSPV